ncbi:MAG: acyl-CoA dehydrogenase family protein [Gammaproteobacteria bacterium]|nr:acyl-CoA dehydrogenase family protein [Gammaproteobacteria bacterium]
MPGCRHTHWNSGSPEQNKRYLRRHPDRPLTPWCQLFSEPGSGSDLAGASTRADKDGDRWLINGQKVWNTSAHHADYGILVARTDWDVPTPGTQLLYPDMKQPGVEVRQLKQMNGHASFNEVFSLTQSREPDDLVGEQVRQDRPLRHCDTFT